MANQNQVTRTSQRYEPQMLRRDPLRRLRQEMDDMFSQYFPEFGLFSEGDAASGLLSAHLDVSETDNTIEIELDVPGISRDNLDITLNDGSVMISGHREEKDETSGRDYHRMERRYGSFQRQVALPCEVDPDKVDARLENGVLSLSLQKSERARNQARKIKISGK